MISRRSAHLTLVLLTVNYVFAYADRYLMAILVQPIKSELRLSDSALGLLTGFAFSAFYAAAGLPLGRIADRVNRRLLLTISLAAWSVATAACGAATSFIQLALARMSVGIGEGGCSPSSHSLIADLFPPGHRAFPLGIFTAGAMAGMLGGFAAGSVLEAHLGWRGAFWALGATGFLFVPVIGLGLKEPRREAASATPSEASLRELFRTPGFLLLALSYSFVTLGFLGITQWLPAFYERSFGLNRVTIGGMLALMSGVGGIVGLVGGGWIADWGSHRSSRWPLYQFVGATVLAIPVQLAVLLVSNPNVSFALTFLAMLFATVGSGPAFAVIQTIVPPGARATATAALLVGYAVIGMGGGPLLIGILSDALQPVWQADSLRRALVAVAAAGGVIAFILGALATRRLHATGLLSTAAPPAR